MGRRRIVIETAADRGIDKSRYINEVIDGLNTISTGVKKHTSYEEVLTAKEMEFIKNNEFKMVLAGLKHGETLLGKKLPICKFLNVKLGLEDTGKLQSVPDNIARKADTKEAINVGQDVKSGKRQQADISHEHGREQIDPAGGISAMAINHPQRG
jgi:hypothetical protein